MTKSMSESEQTRKISRFSRAEKLQPKIKRMGKMKKRKPREEELVRCGEAWAGAKMPTREVETLFATMRLTTNPLDGNRPFAGDDKDHGTEATYKIAKKICDVTDISQEHCFEHAGEQSVDCLERQEHELRTFHKSTSERTWKESVDCVGQGDMKLIRDGVTNIIKSAFPSAHGSRWKRSRSIERWSKF